MATLVETNAIAGPYTLTYIPPAATSAPSAVALGVIGPEGFRLTRNYEGEPIVSDQYGRGTTLDGIYCGGNMFVEFTLQEANRIHCRALAFPFNVTGSTVTGGTTTQSLENELGLPGTLWSAACGSLVATPVAGTLAAAGTTPTWTFSKVALAMGHTIDTFLKTGLKTFPIRLQAFPYDLGSGKIGWFSRA